MFLLLADFSFDQFLFYLYSSALCCSYIKDKIWKCSLCCSAVDVTNYKLFGFRENRGKAVF